MVDNDQSPSSDKEINLDVDFDKEVVSSLEFLAKARGVSAKRLVSEIVLEHIAKLNLINRNNVRRRNDSTCFPLRFIDPADQISVEEDFGDLV